ncbi:hypothetical protein HFX_2539 [Haloferax mediterranei ATCC 33500]|uniref:Uncharacterized protein n=1 Tax=Haloferax mediterranei (strain ATCC 33500 / DSM 1411 / JCM 8866 / NBRC 14739 / NCIMB 2177 / R-4) TaxID=523841 RepID=I3R7L0_HALMT|nr:hypothetical protein HFX_2539 [Haloferax mediterranei ATCC 33500]
MAKHPSEFRAYSPLSHVFTRASDDPNQRELHKHVISAASLNFHSMDSKVVVDDECRNGTLEFDVDGGAEGFVRLDPTTHMGEQTLRRLHVARGGGRHAQFE